MIKKIILFLKVLHNTVINFEKKIDFCSRSNSLLQSALTSENMMIVMTGSDDRELIVSLTTYSKRIHDVHLVIESIAMQTMKPNRFILWLDENEFTLDTIPLVLKKQIERGLEIRFCPNYRSYKKLIPTLRSFPEANIITIDDDVIYPHDMIELLIKEHKDNPLDIIAHRIHKMRFDKNGKLMPYSQWEYESNSTNSSFDNVAIGVGGVFYPHNSLYHEVVDDDKFLQLAPSADDIWFKAMSILTKRKVKKVNDDRDFWSRYLLIPTSQDISLAQKNVHEKENDIQIKKVFEIYSLSDEILKVGSRTSIS